MGRSFPGAIQDEDLVLEEQRLRNEGTDSARTEHPSQDGDEMDEKNGKIAHQRIVAGRRILRNLGRNNNSPAAGSKTGCYQSEKGDEKRVHRGTTIISQMVGTPVFSDRTEFSVTTGYTLRNLRT